MVDESQPRKEDAAMQPHDKGIQSVIEHPQNHAQAQHSEQQEWTPEYLDSFWKDCDPMTAIRKLHKAINAALVAERQLREQREQQIATAMAQVIKERDAERQQRKNADDAYALVSQKNRELHQELGADRQRRILQREKEQLCIQLDTEHKQLLFAQTDNQRLKDQWALTNQDLENTRKRELSALAALKEKESQLIGVMNANESNGKKLLSALAAIEKHNKSCLANEASLSKGYIDVDLSLLHEHDAEVRKPLVEDKFRMDWLDEHFCPHFKHIIPKAHISELSPFKEHTKTVRQAIGNALAKVKQ